MIKVVSVAQMREIERAADASGLTYDRMMENAGKAVAEAVLSRIPELSGKHVLVLVGTGNNGGDGLVAADHLANAGATVAAYLTKDRAENDPHLGRLRARSSFIAVAEQDQRSRVLRLQVGKADIVLDAVLGTGFRLPLTGSTREVLKTAKAALAARSSRPFIVAVDCPSGLDCDTGAVAEETIAADLTVTLAAMKTGLLRFPGADWAGEVIVGDIGLPADQPELTQVQVALSTVEELRRELPPRPADAHKGTFGRAIVVAGSLRYPGAAALAARSAYLVGAGLVTLAVPQPVQALIAPQLPEVTWIPLPAEGGGISRKAIDDLEPDFTRCQALLFGPGFDLAETTGRFLADCLSALRTAAESGESRPCVIDADGLKLLTAVKDWPELLPPGTVLTPHPGEMAVLSGAPKDEIQADRLGAARRWAQSWGQVVVLKGAYTVVADPGGMATVIPIASPALARAGTGDVLAGALVGFLAQGVEVYPAAVLAAHLHGRAGLIAAASAGNPASVLAGDVARALPQALSELLR